MQIGSIWTIQGPTLEMIHQDVYQLRSLYGSCMKWQDFGLLAVDWGAFSTLIFLIVLNQFDPYCVINTHDFD